MTTRAALLTGVGRLLRTLHATPADDPIVPRDVDAAALRRRLEFGFGDIADALAERPRGWTLPMPADEVTARVLGALPASLAQPPVVLHSNPSPTHVFVDPDTGQFTGVIDFGDSYASHPALDLHRWADPADRTAIRAGYLALRTGTGPDVPGPTLPIFLSLLVLTIPILLILLVIQNAAALVFPAWASLGPERATMSLSGLRALDPGLSAPPAERGRRASGAPAVAAQPRVLHEAAARGARGDRPRDVRRLRRALARALCGRRRR
jgi:hypothetical protein